MRGDGWIVLAIVIFAGWHPFRVALGAYMFAALGVASARIQRDPNINFPFVLLNTLPWLMMLFTLAFVNNGVLQRILSVFPGPVRGRLREILRTESPAALGVDFISE
jgi:simple sugar transport system permease protein